MLAAIGGCGDAPATHGWTTVLDTLPSGVVHVTNVPPAAASPTWTLAGELRVGTVEGDGRFAVLDSQAQELRVFGPDGVHLATHGGTALTVETHPPPVPVTAAERDSVIAPMRDMLSRMGAAEWDWSRIPGTRPAVEDIFESAEGNLWVRTPSTGDGVLFDAYSEDGAYLGTASLGPDLGGLSLFERVAPIVRGDLVWLIVTDEFDVPYVVRARIVPPSRPDARLGQSGRRDAFAGLGMGP